MRKFLFLLLLFAETSFCLQAQSHTREEQANAKQTIVGFFNGLATLDTKMMKQYATSDFLLLEDGAVWNMDTLAAKLSPLKTKAFSRTNHFDFIRTDINGNTAWVAYNNSADINLDGQKRNVQWLESAVLVKEENQWKIRLLHSTRLPSKVK